MAKIVVSKNKTLIKSFIIIITKKLTITTNIPSKKTSRNLSNFYIDNYKF